MSAWVHESILARSIKVVLYIGKVELFLWTSGAVFMDMWNYRTGIYKKNEKSVKSA